MKRIGCLTFIGKKTHKTIHTFCDICGWGDVVVYENILVNDRQMDFCKRHTDDEINNYIEMKLPEYDVSKPPISNKSLQKKQFKFKL